MLHPAVVEILAQSVSPKAPRPCALRWPRPLLGQQTGLPHTQLRHCLASLVVEEVIIYILLLRRAPDDGWAEVVACFLIVLRVRSVAERELRTLPAAAQDNLLAWADRNVVDHFPLRLLLDQLVETRTFRVQGKGPLPAPNAGVQHCESR